MTDETVEQMIKLNGILSEETIIEKLGYDYETEKARKEDDLGAGDNMENFNKDVESGEEQDVNETKNSDSKPDEGNEISKENQILTKTEKMEAQKYNAELYSLTGLRFKCNTIRDYYLIKTLYELLSVIQDPVVLEYYDEVLNVYYDKLNIGRPTLKKKL